MCVMTPDTRWNFSVGNFELKLLPEKQSGINFLEGEVVSGDAWRERQRVIVDDGGKRTENQPNQNQHLDLVIKVSVPDWKVMAFSTKPDGQLVWEHQVRRFRQEVSGVGSNPRSEVSARSVPHDLGSGDHYRLTVGRLCPVVLHTHRLGLAGGRRQSHTHHPV